MDRRLDLKSMMEEVLYFAGTNLPKLVRIFFKNLRLGTDAIESTIKDTLIVIDERILRSILEMPRSSVCVLALKKKIYGLKFILERDNVNDLRNFQANQLLVEIRLLYNMVSRIFF